MLVYAAGCAKCIRIEKGTCIYLYFIHSDKIGYFTKWGGGGVPHNLHVAVSSLGVKGVLSKSKEAQLPQLLFTIVVGWEKLKIMEYVFRTIYDLCLLFQSDFFEVKQTSYRPNMRQKIILKLPHSKTVLWGMAKILFTHNMHALNCYILLYFSAKSKRRNLLTKEP